MVQSGQITFYYHYYSPYAHRVHMALEETNAKYTPVLVDVMNKPAYFSEKINPLTGKIPVITYGGPETAPEEPSAESAKIPESLVILDFLAELFPAARLFPADPVQRANARLFIALFETQFFDAFKQVLLAAADPIVLVDAFAALQARLPPTGFAVGAWSMADIAVVPFFVRVLMLLEHEIGKYPLGAGKKALAELQQPRFARLMKYIEDAKAQPSFKKTYDAEKVLEIWQNNPFLKRD